MIKKLISLLLIFNLFSSPCLAIDWTQKPPQGIQVDWSNPITEGLVGCWLFNEGGGDKVYDLSGYGNDGTLTSIALPPTTSSGWNPGEDGAAIAFDGSNDYINCGNNASLKTTTETTIYIRCYPRDVNDWEVQISKMNADWTTDGEYVIEFGGSGNGILRAEYNNNGANIQLTDTGYTVNTWYSIMLTIDSANGGKLFVNGNLVDSDTTGYTLRGTAASVRIGCRFVGKSINSPANTIISKAIIWNRTLTPQEIQQLYINPYGMFKKTEVALWKVGIPTVAKVLQPIINIF